MSAPRLQTRAGRILKNLENKREVVQPSFDREQAEHQSRGLVLLAVFMMLMLELLIITFALTSGVPVEKVKDVAAIILSPTFTLFGTIVGFYFSRGKQ